MRFSQLGCPAATHSTHRFGERRDRLVCAFPGLGPALRTHTFGLSGGWGGKDVYGGRKSNLHCSAGMLLCMFPDWDGWGGGLFLGLKRKGMGQEGWIFALVPGCTFPSWPVLGLAVFPGRGEQGRGQEGLGWNVSASLWCSFVVMLLGWQ